MHRLKRIRTATPTHTYARTRTRTHTDALINVQPIHSWCQDRNVFVLGFISIETCSVSWDGHWPGINLARFHIHTPTHTIKRTFIWHHPQSSTNPIACMIFIVIKNKRHLLLNNALWAKWVRVVSIATAYDLDNPCFTSSLRCALFYWLAWWKECRQRDEYSNHHQDRNFAWDVCSTHGAPSIRLSHNEYNDRTLLAGDETAIDRTDHPLSCAEAKTTTSLTIHTHGCLRAIA